jgi:hypothetical protein
MRRRKTALSFGVLAFVAAAVSCREPTEITVVLATGEKCSDLSGVEIVVGPDQGQTQKRFEQQFTVAVSHECDATGQIGTIVVTPGGSGGTIVVAAGVRVDGAPAPDPATCAVPENAKRCIIARRSFSFLPHTSLTLPIGLDPLCVGKACDPASTCFRGTCVDATVTCNGRDCGLAQEKPGSGTGSGNDASSSDGAYDADLDGTSFEDVVVVDSGKDGTVVVDGGPDADSGDADASAGKTCLFPTGNSASCDPMNGAGMATTGACGGGGLPGQACCMCTCPMGGMVTCTISSSAGGSGSCRSACN